MKKQLAHDDLVLNFAGGFTGIGKLYDCDVDGGESARYFAVSGKKVIEIVGGDTKMLNSFSLGGLVKTKIEVCDYVKQLLVDTLKTKGF